MSTTEVTTNSAPITTDHTPSAPKSDAFQDQENKDAPILAAAPISDQPQQDAPTWRTESPLSTTPKRRVIAEDPEWNLAPVQRLTELCLNSIVANFEKRPHLHLIPTKYLDKVLSTIPTTLSLSLTATLIPDGTYWNRKSQSTFKRCDVAAHGKSWKRLFFERYLQDFIETFTGGDDDASEKLVKELDLAAPFVEKLNLTQLKPLIKDKDGSVESHNTIPVEKRLIEDSQRGELCTSDHFDVGLILTKLVHLKSLNVYYGAKDCGTSFTWSQFGMSLPDCLTLTNALKSPTPQATLTSLTIRASHVDDSKCRLLISALLAGSSLTHLDLSHNKISTGGSRAIAKLISSPPQICQLSTLNLSNNKIPTDGAIPLSHALTQNTTLITLLLRQNILRDHGGAVILASLTHNTILQSIDLAANELGVESVVALCGLLKSNHNKTLTSLDLSCNKFSRMAESNSMSDGAKILAQTSQAIKELEQMSGGAGAGGMADAVGKMLLDAVSQNKYIQVIDLRLTDLTEQYAIAIQGILNENKATV